MQTSKTLGQLSVVDGEGGFAVPVSRVYLLAPQLLQGCGLWWAVGVGEHLALQT